VRFSPNDREKEGAHSFLGCIAVSASFSSSHVCAETPLKRASASSAAALRPDAEMEAEKLISPLATITPRSRSSLTMEHRR